MENNKNNKELNIDLPDEIAEGVFSNLALINHSPTEFVVDFIQIMPGKPKAKVRSRVILTPEHAKRFVQAMTDNLAKYETQFGKIEDHNVPNIPVNFNKQGEA